jgi:thioredoxin 1
MTQLSNNRGIQAVGLIIGIVVVLTIGGGIYYFTQNTTTNTNTTNNTNQAVMEKVDDAMEKDANTNAVMDDPDTMEDDEVMMEDETTNTNTTTNTNQVSANPGAYVDYAASTFNADTGKKRVLFFHAAWCPTCKVANIDINNNVSQLPDNVVVYKTDYDTESALKSKYGITYQHTFVYVDASGTVISKWNGGGVDEIIARVN